MKGWESAVVGGNVVGMDSKKIDLPPQERCLIKFHLLYIYVEGHVKLDHPDLTIATGFLSPTFGQRAASASQATTRCPSFSPQNWNDQLQQPKKEPIPVSTTPLPKTVSEPKNSMASFGSRKRSLQNPALPRKMASTVTAKPLLQANLGSPIWLKCFSFFVSSFFWRWEVWLVNLLLMIDIFDIFDMRFS